MNEKELRKLISEQFSGMILEQAEEETPEESEESDKDSALDSIDDQIDELFLQYEKHSLPNEEEAIQEIVQKCSLRFILEQSDEDKTEEDNVEEEESEEDIKADTEEAAEEADEVEEDEISDVNEEEIPEIDITTFALKVARLAELPEKVLDLKAAIINRAVQYLETNYNKNVAEDFESALMDKFQLSVPEAEIEKVIDADLPAPPAVGAGSGGGGAGG